MPKTGEITLKEVPGAAATHEQSTEAGTQKPTYEQISQKAYELWEENGRQHGGHDQDWEKAESELLNS